MEVEMGEPKSKLRGGLGSAANSALADQELVVDEMEGLQGEAIVVTDKRVLVIKAGFSSGALFGRKVKSYPYHQITSIEVSVGLTLGRIQLSVAGTSEAWLRSDIVNLSQAENVVQISRAQLEDARRIAALIEERIAASQQPNQPSQLSLAGELAKLAELKESGVLSDEEFQAAKKRLLG